MTKHTTAKAEPRCTLNRLSPLDGRGESVPVAAVKQDVPARLVSTGRIYISCVSPVPPLSVAYEGRQAGRAEGVAV